MFVRLIAFTCLFASAAAVPAVAAGPDSAKANASKSEKKICEDIVFTGSRLASRRYCGTKAEWEDRRQQDKDAVNLIQTRMNGPCSTINQHTGTPTC